MCSAAAIVFPVGALTTVMPARVAASRSTLSTPTPGAPDDDEPRARGDQRGVDLDLAADDERVVVGQDRAQLVARQPGSLVDLVVPPGGARALRRRPVRRRGSSRPAHRRSSAPPARTPRSAAAWAAATAAPGRIGRPAPIDANSSVLMAPRISSTVTDPRWPSRKILPVSLPWPPASTTPRRLTSPLNAFQSRSSGTRAAVTVFEATLASASSSKPSADRPARAAAAQAS